ncbi:ADP-ribosylation factor-like protein 10 isoform X1 [Strix aluco]|uniref:ADP-ribosylation factor-like protein 10 isoform X1 n=1 Tax=Strix aluco TaxID=111821 RepID=UPI003DA50798
MALGDPPAAHPAGKGSSVWTTPGAHWVGDGCAEAGGAGKDPLLPAGPSTSCLSIGLWVLGPAPPHPTPCGTPQLDWRQVLVLGLDGAGKSSVVHYICSQTAREHIAPTRSFNSAQLYVEGLEMDLLEVGGSQNLRVYWPHYLSQAHVLVFVVDSVDRSRLLTARQELHTLLAAEPRLPLVVLANKQDKSDALSAAELREELALHTLSEQRELFLLPTSATWASLSTATSVLRVKSLLVTLLSQP